MNTIIEKIRAEVNRLWNEHPTEDIWDRGYNYACEEIMSFLSDLEKSEKPINPTIEKIRALINMQIRREELNFASLGGGGQTMNIGALEWVLKQLDTLQKQPVWHDVEKETPTSFGEGVIVLCKNKNKEDGIWLTDFIPCWEGEWKPRDNWETPVKWAYVRDFYPKAEQSVTLSVQDAMKSLDEKIAKVKKDGSWKNPELLDEMRAEQPVCDGLEEEIERMVKCEEEFMNFQCRSQLIGYMARHFAKWGAEHRGSSEIPKDLEEAAKAYADDTNPTDSFYEAFKEGALWMREQMMDEWLKDRDGCFWDGVEEGKKAMREQMMKEAVEGEVVTTNKYTSVRYLSRYGTFRYFYGIGGGFQKGDKVKLIIVKED